MLTYIGVLEAAAGQGRNAYQLNPAEVQQLAAMVDVHYDRPANWASNLLCAVYGQCRAPYTGGAGVEKSRGRTRDTSKPEPERGAAFSVQPNPARDHVVLRYDFGGPAPHARAVLRDPGGRILQHMQLRGERGQEHLTLADLANGSYVIQYFSGEQLVHSERFVVQR
jgi:hypothetical protein